MPSRRTFLQWALLAPLSRPVLAQAGGPRVIILDWGLTEMALSLGIVPVGISAPAWYRRLFAQPALPPGVQDVGLLFQPNFETLKALRPDAIIITPAHGLLRQELIKIAPLVTLGNWYGRPLPLIERDTRRMAQSFGRQAAAAGLIDAATRRLEQARQRLAGLQGTAVFIASVVDTLHLRLYVQGGLFDDVLRRLGLRNAWPGGNNGQGEALVELQRIAATENARLVLMLDVPGPVPAEATPLWKSLPLTQSGNIVRLSPGIPSLGALTTAVRFAESLTAELLRPKEQRHA